MAQLAVFSGVFLIALLAFVSEASFEQSQNCQQQVHQTGQQIHQCQEFLFKGSKYEIQVISPTSIRQQQRFRECCQGLQNLDRQCRCDAVKQVVLGLQQQVQQGQGQKGGQQIETLEEKVKRAKDLPKACNLETRQC